MGPAGKYKWLLLICMTGWLVACAADKTIEQEAPNIVFPPPPESAKVQYVRSFSRPADLGIRRGFFQWLSDFFTGEENFQLRRPMSVVVTGNGKIYVADPGAKGVHRFDIKGGEYELVAREDEKILPSPVALSLGPDNSVYVADSELSQVFQIADRSDVAVQVFPSLALQQPTGLAYDKSSRRLYITETATHSIKVVNPDGGLYRTIGRRGSGKGEFNFPTYLWIDDKARLYVTDSLNFRVQIFDREGKYIGRFGRLGDGRGHMSRPKGVAVDRSGHIYVVDALFNAIQIFNNRGELLLAMGTNGHKPGEFWLPAGIFLNNNDEIYVADSHNQRVQILRYIGGRR